VNPVDEFFSYVASVAAVVIFLSGLDDMFIDLNFLFRKSRYQRRRLRVEDIDALVQKPIAIMVAAWHESAVIGDMLRHALEGIDYQRYHFLVGYYDNDPETRDAINEVAAVFSNVHAVPVGHPGPTTKADCLNSIYVGAAELERQLGMRFEIIVLHDAEDVIHPKSLKVLNALIPESDFVQLPVFPLEVEASRVTCWTYADEFAVNHLRDLPVREKIGGIVPCAGVGCGFARSVLEELVEKRGTLFDDWSLTEDYHLSVELRRMGKRESYLAVSLVRGTGQSVTEEIVATREYFPMSLRRAVRQKARWITGIVLQSIGRVKFRGKLPFVYCLYRDRKGLITTPVSLLATLLFFYCIFRHLGSVAGWWSFHLEDVVEPGSLTFWLLLIDTLFAFEYVIVKLTAVERVYGPGHAVLSIPRTLWLNWVNMMADALAVYNFSRAKLTGRALVWAKTQHAFPTAKPRVAPRETHLRLGDMLVGAKLITGAQLSEALAEQRQSGDKLGRILIRRQYLSEQEFLTAYAHQLGLERRDIDPYAVDPAAIERCPEEVARRHGIFPLALAEGALLVAAEEPPPEGAGLDAALGMRVRPVLATRADIAFALDRGYRRRGAMRSRSPRGLPLVWAGALGEEDLARALRVHREGRRHLWEVLLEDGYCQPETLAGLAPEGEGIEFRARVDADPELLRLLPPGLARTLGVIPIGRQGATLTLAGSAPLPTSVSALLTARTGLTLHSVRVPKRPLREAIESANAALGNELRFGTFLVGRGVLSQRKLEEVLQGPAQAGRVGARLCAAGLLSEIDLLSAFSEYTGIPCTRTLTVEPARRWCLPAALCEASSVCPVPIGEAVGVALPISFAPELLDEVRWILAGHDLELVLAPQREIRQAIEAVYGIQALGGTK
jgi:adsorption protein B